MKYVISSLIVLCMCVQIFSQELSNKEMRYKPKNLDDAIQLLIKIHDDSTKKMIITIHEDEFVARNHFGLGMTIRNDWGLWSGGELRDWFNSIGIFHPDDMSGIILKSYHRYLSGADIDLSGQVAYYQHYWKTMSIPTKEYYPEGVKRLRRETDLFYKNEMNQHGCAHILLCPKDDSLWLYDCDFGWKLIDNVTAEKLKQYPDNRNILLKAIYDKE